MEKLYKVIVPTGINSIPLSLEEAFEYAFDCNTEHHIVDLATGKFLDEEVEWANFGRIA